VQGQHICALFSMQLSQRQSQCKQEQLQLSMLV